MNTHRPIPSRQASRGDDQPSLRRFLKAMGVQKPTLSQLVSWSIALMSIAFFLGTMEGMTADHIPRNLAKTAIFTALLILLSIAVREVTFRLRKRTPRLPGGRK